MQPSSVGSLQFHITSVTYHRPCRCSGGSHKVKSFNNKNYNVFKLQHYTKKKHLQFDSTHNIKTNNKKVTKSNYSEYLPARIVTPFFFN